MALWAVSSEWEEMRPRAHAQSQLSARKLVPCARFICWDRCLAHARQYQRSSATLPTKVGGEPTRNITDHPFLLSVFCTALLRRWKWGSPTILAVSHLRNEMLCPDRDVNIGEWSPVDRLLMARSRSEYRPMNFVLSDQETDNVRQG